MKSPAFQFYPNDWLGSTKVSLMTPEEEGAYIRLLCHLWGQNTCSLPNDDQVLASLSRLGEKWLQSKEKILNCFLIKNGKIYNKRLTNEKNKQIKFRKKQAVNGSKGGRPKKGLGLSGLSQTEAKKSSASSASSSIAINSLSRETVFEYMRIATIKTIPDETIFKESQLLIEKYQGQPIENLRALCNRWAANLKPPAKTMQI